jgi:hypothetical protein
MWINFHTHKKKKKIYNLLRWSENYKIAKRVHGLIQGSLAVPNIDLGPPKFERVTTSFHQNKQNKQKLYIHIWFYIIM